MDNQHDVIQQNAAMFFSNTTKLKIQRLISRTPFGVSGQPSLHAYIAERNLRLGGPNGQNTFIAFF